MFFSITHLIYDEKSHPIITFEVMELERIKPYGVNVRKKVDNHRLEQPH